MIGVVEDKTAKAYPLHILNWHEVVNDTVAGRGDSRLAAKEKVIGARVGDTNKAYPLSALQQLTQPLKETVGGKALTITHQPEGQSATVVETATGRPVATVTTYWFAWVTFHPETEVYGLPEGSP